MPTYEYRCNACQNTWDEFQSIKAEPTKKCPKCRKAKAERIISAGGGIIFKGSGFYQTDYRSESYKKGAEAAKSASEGAGKGSDAASSSSSSSEKSGGSDSKKSNVGA
jgi:putative FmdB family regulatory protein